MNDAPRSAPLPASARTAQYEAGDISEHSYLQSLASLHANLASVDGYDLLRRLFAEG